MLAIAHRSGNTVAGLREALDLGVDLVEADVHAYRGVLEMRHHKNLGPRHLWDKWELVARRDFLQVELSELLDELGDDPRLMIDLKGIRPRPRPCGLRGVADACAGGAVHGLHQAVGDARRVRPPRSHGAVGGQPQVADAAAAPARCQPAYGVSVRLRLLTPELVAELRDRTEVVMAWSVDTPEALAHARALGVER